MNMCWAVYKHIQFATPASIIRKERAIVYKCLVDQTHAGLCLGPPVTAWLHSRLHAAASKTTTQPVEDASGAAWGDLSGTAYSADLVLTTMSQVLMLAHHVHLWWLLDVSFQLIDVLLLMDARMLMGQLRSRFRCVGECDCAMWPPGSNACRHSKYMDYRAVTWALQHSFKDATHNHSAGDHECAICKDAMGTAKELPCGHVFHLHCLRALLQRSVAAGPARCPLCRAALVGRPLQPVERSVCNAGFACIPTCFPTVATAGVEQVAVATQ